MVGISMSDQSTLSIGDMVRLDDRKVLRARHINVLADLRSEHVHL